jgi:CRP-like cAMP-binding protein
LVGGIRRAGVKALTTCELQALSRRNLNILILEYPDVGEELKRVAKDRAKVVKQERRSSQTMKANLETKKYNRVGSNIVDSR